jgi:regulator of protease activity HflC (stomatin/prohibitin superfamily)
VREPTRATADAIVDYFERLLKANEDSTERFNGLEPPESLEDAHADALKANRDGVREVRRVIAELKDDGDPRQVLTSAQERLQRLSADAANAAQRLGVPECADQ